MTETEKYIAKFPENVQDILNEIRQIGFYATPTGHEEFKKNFQSINRAKVRCSFI